ncbi:hypothetical protein Agub_g4354, partial [Astrephomene gubernaculifera]
MRRSQALLSRVWLQQSAQAWSQVLPSTQLSAVHASAHTRSATSQTSQRCILPATQLIRALAQAHLLLPTSPIPSDIHGVASSPFAALTCRQLHSSAAAQAEDGADRAAALRRLAAARTRRQRSVAAAEVARERSAASEEGDLQQQQQAAQGGDALAPAAPTAMITPVEGKATEAQLAAALDHAALIVTRPIEWGTVIFGYEQANKYTVYDEAGRLVALVAEDWGGWGKEVGRQLLRQRRSFTATVFSADGSQVLFRLRRPAYLVSSTMFVEDGEGAPIGEIHQRWHLMKRNYDLYMGKSQFAAISGNFLAWEFQLQDASGATLALVDRNFQGFAKEIFTDAGKYVVHFGGNQLQQQQQQQAEQQPQQPQLQQVAGGTGAAAAPHQPEQQQQQQEAAPGAGPAAPAAGAAAAATPAATPAAATPAAGSPGAPPSVTPMAVARTDVPVISTSGGNQLVVARPLALPERMVALACALTIDYDYFSQHSRHGGGLVPPVVVPVPMPAPVPG